MNKKTIVVLCLIFINIVCLNICFLNFVYLYNKTNNPKTELNLQEKEEKDLYTNIKLTAVGDCTIGYDEDFGYAYSFNQVAAEKGYNHFFENVLDILNKDDLTIANLEGTFTESNIKKEKAFNFKAPYEFVNILKEGNIEVVNVANNHTYDYNEIGFTDTINTLKEFDIKYFGYEDYYIYHKENISIGFAGIYCIEDRNCTKNIDSAINNLKSSDVNLIILSFHWGIEKSYKQSEIQTYLAHYAIDNGVDLVLGHHPHVLQGIELYKDKYIVYSLANFSFGGNKNPADKDTMIFQIEYKYINDILKDTIIKIYPASISSQNNINDYKPTLVTGSEYERIMNKINKNSIGVNLI